jgi:hypothetical protein
MRRGEVPPAPRGSRLCTCATSRVADDNLNPCDAPTLNPAFRSPVPFERLCGGLVLARRFGLAIPRLSP